LPAFTACSAPNGNIKKASSDIFAMDTIMSLDVYGEGAEQALSAAEKEIYRLENLLSATIEDSDIFKINSSQAGEKVEVSKETAEIITFSNKINFRTGGAFDISIAPVVKAWGFIGGEHRIPLPKEIETLLNLVDSSSILVEENSVTLLKQGMMLDLGAIGKGYASDKVLEVLKNYGIKSAIMSLGGNIATLGSKADGSSWRILLQDPKNAESFVGKVMVSDKMVISSRGYERYFEKDGKAYHHIIDPKTGYPADSGLLMTTIICDNGALGDSLSTATFVMGEEKAIDFWRASDDFEMVLVTEDGRVLVTEPIASIFEFTGDASGYKYEIVER
jgi:thiamine biosynthesis lipoprotein